MNKSDLIRVITYHPPKEIESELRKEYDPGLTVLKQYGKTKVYFQKVEHAVLFLNDLRGVSRDYCLRVKPSGITVSVTHNPS